MALTEDEIEVAQFRINDCAVGNFELAQIYGEFWDAIPNPTHFGKRFKQSVRKGELRGISLGVRTSDNHQTYDIKAFQF